MDLRMFPNKTVKQSLIDNRYIGRKPIYEFLKKNAEHMKGVLLDYGAGTMPYKDLFANVHKYIGLDYAVTASSAGYYKEDILYYDGKIIPLNDETIDSVLCNQVLEHVDDLDLSLSEIYRVMRPGGVLLLTLPAAYPLHMVPYDFRRFTYYGIQKMLEELGFADIKITGSTCPKDTIRRLRLFCVPCRFQKIYAFIVNMLYLIECNALSRRRNWLNSIRRILGKQQKDYDENNLLYPLDYLVICYKCR